jgi:hypothetical protein
MSYFEPSRPHFERRRIGSLTRLLDWIGGQPPWRRVVGTAALALYVGGAVAFCGTTLAASAATGIILAFLLAGLIAVYRRGWPVASMLSFGLLTTLGALALLLPAIVYAVLGFWLLISLPLWLFRG